MWDSIIELVALGLIFFVLYITELFTLSLDRSIQKFKYNVIQVINLVPKQKTPPAPRPKPPPLKPQTPRPFIKPANLPTDKLAEKRKHIIKEFLDTERTYVTNLKVAIERFITPLKSIISKQSIHIIFGSWEQVYGINSMFLKALEESLNEQKMDANLKFAEMLTTFSQCFKLYTSYISNYNKAIATIKKETKENEKFAQFLKATSEQLKREKYRINSLSSFLILPVQRLPRYRLLLEDLLKHTPLEDKQVHDKISEAADAIAMVAEYCNQKQHELESLIRMTELYEKLDIDDLIQPHRKSIRVDESGTFKTFGKRGDLISVKGVYLFSDLFVCVYVKKSKLLKRMITKTHQIPLWDEEYSSDNYIKAGQMSGKKIFKRNLLEDNECGFYILNRIKDEERKIICNSPQVCKEWVKAINDQISIKRSELLSNSKLHMNVAGSPSVREKNVE